MIKDTYPMFVTEWEFEALPTVGAPPAAEESKPIALPAPHTWGGRPLMDVLKDRHSCREFSSLPLSDQLLSDLIWCAFGINRPALQGRTAPSAQNWQEIAIYVARHDGLFVFEPMAHALMRLSKVDIRAQTGLQEYAAIAPVDLVYVADFSRAGNATEEERRLYSVADTGFIAQNVYLFCASQGLGTCVRGAIDRQLLASAMRLRPSQRIILAQSVGHPTNPH